MRLSHLLPFLFVSAVFVHAQEIEDVDCEILPVVGFASEINTRYEIEVSREGLEDFEPLATEFGNGERITYLDDAPRSSNCFYRVIASPAEVAPYSLDGVRLSITQNQGPTLSFVAFRGQDPGSGEAERGIFSYRVESEQQGFQLDELSATLAEVGEGANEDEILQLFRKWPEGVERSNYLYTRIDQSTGRLEITGSTRHGPISATRRTIEDGFYVFKEAEIFLDDATTSNPHVITLSFRGDESGHIVGCDGILEAEVSSEGAAEKSTVEVPLGLKAALADDQPLPFGHSSDYQGEPVSPPDLLAAQPLLFLDAEDLTSLRYEFRARAPEDNVEYQENGTFTCVYRPDEEPVSSEVTLSGSYEVAALAGSGNLELILDYNEADAPTLFDDGEVLDGAVLLAFDSMQYARPSEDRQKIGSFSFVERF